MSPTDETSPRPAWIHPSADGEPELDISSLEGLLRASPSLETSLPGLRRAAASSAPILILGEAGTGRSALARAIHRSSPRHHGPLVEMDPGAVPSTLFESDLFGYRAGAFTGAEADRPGRVQRAEGGTLVLDHVEDLPLASQPKLLRLLSESRYTPLGGEEQRCDVRFVATSTPDLPRRVEGGTFRADLFYRLEVLAFHLPPLRRRQQDLTFVVRHLLADLADRFERPIPFLTERSRTWMDDYSWPGNLRQVRNVLEREMVATADIELDPPPPDEPSGRRPMSLEELERRHIAETLAFTRGHQGQAAEILGISRKALWQKRRRFGLP
ncbi:MAG: sigma 54-interacting transcriptional regulator [Holophagales bacterium]|nr:sigma 54-interacting transcriptional regulator [Holophagales bacterium]